MIENNEYPTDEIIEELERQARAYDAKPGEPIPERDLMLCAARRLRRYLNENIMRAKLVRESIMMGRHPPGFEG